jgi:hypothetical protein
MADVYRPNVSPEMRDMASSWASKAETKKKKMSPLVKAMVTKHEVPEEERDLHLEPGVRSGKSKLEAALETQPDRRTLENKGIVPAAGGFSAAASLQKVKGGGFETTVSESSMVVQTVPDDTVASRIDALYSKINQAEDKREAPVAAPDSVIASVELSENREAVGGGAARQEELESRLKHLDQRFTKAQSLEAEKYKVLRMLLVRTQEDAGVEKVSLDVIKERYDRELRSLESGILLDLNVHRQARRCLDRSLAQQIDDKFGIFSAELTEERQERMEAATRISFDPSIVPVLTSNIEEEGTLRYDRGEQLLEKIREKTVNLHNMLSCEEDAHTNIEEFTGQIQKRCEELKATISEEADHRAEIVAKHTQRMEQLRELEADIGEDRRKRERRRNEIKTKVQDEMANFFTFVQGEQGNRQKSEEYILRMCDDATDKLETEIKVERDEREGSEEKFFKLLEDTCQRARNRL